MSDTVRVEAIREGQEYGGTRITLMATLGKSGSALAATFERRQTPLPSEMPIALTKEFGDDLQKGRQWAAFVGRIRGADHTDLTEVIDVLCAFLWPRARDHCKSSET